MIVTQLFKHYLLNIFSNMHTTTNLIDEKHESEDTSIVTPQKSIPFSGYAGQYELVRKIQMGGQASIYLSCKDNICYALKVYNHGEIQQRLFDHEVSISQRLKSKGIVSVIQAISNINFKWQNQEEKNTHIIVMPYIKNGDLLEWIKNRGSFSQNIGKYFGKKLIATFRYLRSQHVFHRDIKPQNILLDDHFNPLLLDFGLSLDSRTKIHNFVGDIRFASPQVIKHIQYTQKSQIYSFGILLFYILTGNFAMAHAKTSDVNYRLLLERKHNIFWQRVNNKTKKPLSQNFKDLFLKMVSPNPTNRPNFDNILQHCWFSQQQHFGQKDYQDYFVQPAYA